MRESGDARIIIIRRRVVEFGLDDDQTLMEKPLTQQGYLLIADISGYTAYVANTELEHSHELLTSIMELLLARLGTLLTPSKLEGDAVFGYVPDARVPRSEILLELVESTYCAFRDWQFSTRRATSCTCNACRNIPSLDLKFLVHHGDYLFQQIGSVREMIGSDVNLIHRLTKNHLSDETGWHAYALFTKQCLAHMGLWLDGAHRQTEAYEHLGEVDTFSIDLHRRYDEIINTRQIVVSADEADLAFSVDFDTPPPIAWEWFHDPAKRNLWSPDVRWSVGQRPGGRTGRGAINHCAHGRGSSTQVVLDWRPFEYSTLESWERGRKNATETVRFEALPHGGTRLHSFMRVYIPLPHQIRKIVARQLMLRRFRYDQAILEAARLAREQNGAEEQQAFEPLITEPVA
jgi:hypothetical protein